MRQIEVTSIQDLLIELEREQYSGATWFRGQANSTWELIPGYFRLTKPPSESTLMKKFKQSAAMLIDNIPKLSFDWLFLMQHYGVPTRLLDWSESPLVALYFAVEDKIIDQEGALWALRPTELNKNAGINNKDEDFFIPSFDDTELENYTVERLSQNQRTQLKPVATIATRNNSRIQAQYGVFTIHHLEKSPIESIGDQSHIIKYVIPKNHKEEINKQLSLLGVTKFQLFPELASIGDIIMDGLK
ncbi:FRG domain-containing protein [Marispirochaeta sp.]|uniref:FRG domain-containing protein n=1 Tax=Marispirochaeta sp. TaxID=2038653 RepID=UPI0029C6D554|nr:FRG domain-containing protein [Marispirochaeta sp.]